MSQEVFSIRPYFLMPYSTALTDLTFFTRNIAGSVRPKRFKL